MSQEIADQVRLALLGLTVCSKCKGEIPNSKILVGGADRAIGEQRWICGNCWHIHQPEQLKTKIGPL